MNKKTSAEQEPSLAQQAKHLNAIPVTALQQLLNLHHELKAQQFDPFTMSSELFGQLFNKVYELGLIFSFDWMEWEEGWQKINDTDSDYSNRSLLQLSMYLTMIFRNDRFFEGTLAGHYNSGVLGKILNQMVAAGLREAGDNQKKAMD